MESKQKLQQQPLEDPASLFPWCSWCGEQDHRWRACPEGLPADWCGHCEEYGHNWAGCPYAPAQASAACPLLSEEPAACPLLSEEPAACPLLSEEPAACPLLSEEPAAFPLLSEEPAAFPLLSEEPAAFPLLSEEPAAFPLLSEEPAAFPLLSEEPAAFPLLSEEPAAFPLLSEEPAAFPLLSEEPAAFPLLSEEPAAFPLLSEEPAAFPLLSEEPAVFPLLSEEPAAFPLLSEEPAAFPLLSEEPAAFPLGGPLSQQCGHRAGRCPESLTALESEEVLQEEMCSSPTVWAGESNGVPIVGSSKASVELMWALAKGDWELVKKIQNDILTQATGMVTPIGMESSSAAASSAAMRTRWNLLRLDIQGRRVQRDQERMKQKVQQSALVPTTGSAVGLMTSQGSRNGWFCYRPNWTPF
ncbi:UNVERIFIED_CONTAM: hypothetical protein FKN15_066185 [Acipenser sinensis]